MLLKQYYLGCLAHASYLIGDVQTRTAVVVDPQRDIDQYLQDAQAEGLEIRHVFLTHFHADFVAGHLEMRQRTGAQIHLNARAQAEYDFVAMNDGDELRCGRVLLRTLSTPGHTPESMCILVYDLDESTDQPHAALTGDTLFIGDVGRPDLGASVGWKAEDLASLLYDSLHSKLLPAIADPTLVYPAHGAGSMCGRSLSEETFSTFENQKRYNYALQPMDRKEFVRLVTADQPEAPAYFSYDAEMNTRERPILAGNMATSLQALSLDEVLRLQKDGGQILDTRDAEDYAGAHLAGSINIGLDGRYATWAGTLLDHDVPIVVITAAGSEEEAVMRLGRIGFDQVAGYLADGMLALAPRPDLVSRVARMTARDVQERQAEGLFLLDVRTSTEHAEAAIPGSAHIPLNQLRQRLDEIPFDRPIVIYCAGGYRSSAAASLLLQRGLSIFDLVGGFSSWESLQAQAAS